MSFILLIIVSISLAILNNVKYGNLKKKNLLAVTFVIYLFIVYMITILYSLISGNDDAKYIVAILVFLGFLIVIKRDVIIMKPKKITIDSVVLFISFNVLNQISEIEFIREKFINGDAYSYAFAALDLNTSDDMNIYDWTKHRVTFTFFVQSVIYKMKNLNNTDELLINDSILTSVAASSILYIFFFIVTSLRLIVELIKSKLSVIILGLVFLAYVTSNFVTGPLILGGATNVVMAHWFITTSVLIYILNSKKQISNRFSILIQIIISILILTTYPLLIPIPFILTIKLIYKNQYMLSDFIFLILSVILIINVILTYDLLKQQRDLAISGTFVSFNFNAHLALYVLSLFIICIIYKDKKEIFIYLMYLLSTFIYISIPYYVKFNSYLNYYNTKFLYLIIVPSLLLFVLLIVRHLIKIGQKIIVILSLIIMLCASIFQDRSLLTSRVQDIELSKSIYDLFEEKVDRVYYVDYLNIKDEELLLNLWADTRNINYTRAWIQGNPQSKGVELIFKNWRDDPEVRICEYVVFFPNSLIISRSNESISEAKRYCSFDSEVRN
jgi:hypothetical protein